MAHNPTSQRREHPLFDPLLWLFMGIVLFFAWAYSPLSGGGLHQSEKAKTQAALTQIEQFMTAAQLFTIDNSHAPKSLDDLIHQPSHAKHWKKYLADLNEIPKDPWGDDYVYQSPSPRGGPYRITSDGPDGRPGTKDDITSATLANTGG